MSHNIHSTKEVLTKSERRVLHLIAQSKTNREIALELRISPATVKRHVENIFRKLHLRNRVEAAIYALTLDGCPAPRQVSCPLQVWRGKLLEPLRNWAG
jgi:DNA-binding NarL/FixJ family response regulator